MLPGTLQNKFVSHRGIAACLGAAGLLSRAMTDPVLAPVSRPAHPRWLFVVMILLSIGYAMGFLCSVFGVLMSPFLFDSGDTARNWHAFFLVLALPVVLLIGTAMSWIAYRSRKYMLIPLGLVLPLVDVVVFVNVFS
jgi:hypothetical protein